MERRRAEAIASTGNRWLVCVHLWELLLKCWGDCQLVQRACLQLLLAALQPSTFAAVCILTMYPNCICTFVFCLFFLIERF